VLGFGEVNEEQRLVGRECASTAPSTALRAVEESVQKFQARSGGLLRETGVPC